MTFSLEHPLQFIKTISGQILGLCKATHRDDVKKESVTYGVCFGRPRLTHERSFQKKKYGNINQAVDHRS